MHLQSRINRSAATVALAACALASFVSAPANAQPQIKSKVDITFNHYNDYDHIISYLHAFADAYPSLVRLQRIGASGEGRPMYVAIVASSKGAPASERPAMYIDGNVHGNEIQGAEIVLYTLWDLTRSYGVVDNITKLLDTYTFYLVPSQNPDGRQNWFDTANTPNSSRVNKRPKDNDNDGLFDEDSYDDLDGDGSITQMWKKDPHGQWRRDADDPRVFTRVKEGQQGDWTYLGSEGIDNDGDGRVNEDPPGGDDMNRDWPSDWQPPYVQRGAAPLPLYNAETRSIATFILAHPNIAGVQSFHNAGGMILRGPAASYVAGAYPPEDNRVLDAIGKVGEKLLPYYRYMVIYKDLYTVHGGFVNWTNEGLGIYSFTNEIFNPGMYFQRDVNRPSAEQMQFFRDRLLFGQVFKPFETINHPEYGEILVGGLNKWASRVTPAFMLEEEAHRNFAFTMFHADQMPVLSFGDTRIERLRDGLWSVTFEIKNEKRMPTRSGIAARNHIGEPDILTCSPVGDRAQVVASGSLERWLDPRMDAVEHEPARILLDHGAPGMGSVIHRFIIAGAEGDRLQMRYHAEKAVDIETTLTLR